MDERTPSTPERSRGDVQFVDAFHGAPSDGEGDLVGDQT
jgi:hypothetical protein